MKLAHATERLLIFCQLEVEKVKTFTPISSNNKLSWIEFLFNNSALYATATACHNMRTHRTNRSPSSDGSPHSQMRLLSSIYKSLSDLAILHYLDCRCLWSLRLDKEASANITRPSTLSFEHWKITVLRCRVDIKDSVHSINGWKLWMHYRLPKRCFSSLSYVSILPHVKTRQWDGSNFAARTTP